MLKIIFKILKGISIFLILTDLGLLLLSKYVYLNTTNSMPIGLYLIKEKKLDRGDIVVVCESKAGIFLRRKNDTICGYEYILKKVAAIEGDIVSISINGVVVNGKKINNTQQKIFDKQYEFLNSFKIQNYKLKNDEILILGEGLESWDSRYFGVSNKRNVVDVISKLLTI